MSTVVAADVHNAESHSEKNSRAVRISIIKGMKTRMDLDDALVIICQRQSAI